ncbi:MULTISPECIES: energy transducer TonB [unclassified Bradyrhizobium]|uniref:energy transducer TonB n=1 Tax=unclassified Bradyrhizobium TaxID=2631580 RepID=UPI0028E7CDF5|nr:MULTISPECIES: energy transducer TonB [unclassified Bradyrhizobium]
MAQSAWWSKHLDEESQHHDWRAAAPAIGLRSLAAVAMTVPALLAVGVYWLRHTPTGTGMHSSDNVMQVRLVASPAADAARPAVTPTAPALSPASAPAQDPKVVAAAVVAGSESVTTRDSTASGLVLSHLPAAPAWDAPVPGSPLAAQQTKPDQKTMTFVRTVKSHIARFQYYPERAQRERIQGQVGLVLTLRRDGTVTNVRIASSSGFASLDAAAVDTVRRAQPLPSIPVELPGQLSLDYTIAFDLPQ